MIERVAILLNEREPVKRSLAEQLTAHLSASHISSRRYPISETMFDEIATRAPLVVVTDYVLGDLSTGLDLLERVSKKMAHSAPTFFFLTDESSALVAVEALKLGAQDYFIFSQPQALQSCLDAIVRVVYLAAQSSPRLPAAVTLDTMAQTAPASTTLRHTLQALAEAPPPLVVLHGATGSGLSTYAHALYHAVSQSFPLMVESVDLRRDLRSAQDIFARIQSADRSRVGRALICLGVEEDARLLAALRALLNKSKAAESHPHLCLCTNDRSFAQALCAETKAALITVPSFSERKADLPILIDSWLGALKLAVPRAFQSPSREEITQLQQQEWPGNLAQLRAVVTAAVADSSREPLAARIARMRQVYEYRNLSSKTEVSPVEVWRCLRQTQYDYRAAAVALGISTVQLREVLHGE